jgi:Uma2 family endonuclease
MAMPTLSQDDWTVAKLHALPDDGNRYEIIDGVLHVTPSPSFAHQGVIGELFLRLKPYAEPLGIGVMFSPADIQYSERTVVQPDLFAFRNPTNTAPRTWDDVQPLLLAVEVVSPSTQRRDRGVKRELFQAQGVPEYWVLDAFRRQIERWRPASTAAEVLTTSLAWQPNPTHEPLIVDLVSFFRRVTGDGAIPSARENDDARTDIGR